MISVTSWKQYQEDTATVFRSMGFEADTDVHLEGVRGGHDIDVVVRTRNIGVDQLWIVDCKRWRSRVRKQELLAFRSIAADVGADRGIMLSSRGFGFGAVRGARHTNISLTSLSRLQENAGGDLLEFASRQIAGRLIAANDKQGRLVTRKTFDRGRIRITFLPGVDADTVFELRRRVLRMQGVLEYLAANEFPVILDFLPYGAEMVHNAQELMVAGGRFMDWVDATLDAQIANAATAAGPRRVPA